MTSSQRNDESERLLEPRVGHKLEIKFAIQGEVIRQGNQRKLSSASKIMLWKRTR